MIYDCFTFFNELDLLEIRLNTLAPVVDRFVIAEATRTFRGQLKELLFEKNRERFAAFADKIVYVVVEDMLSEVEISKDVFYLPWFNESRQRNALMRGIANLRDDDIVLISDLDEIPRPERLREAIELARRGEVIRLDMANYAYFLNFRNGTNPHWGAGTVVASGAVFTQKKSPLDRIPCDRYLVAEENKGRTFCRLRFVREDRRLRDGGWHFSYLGGIDKIMYKLASYSHSEVSTIPREAVAQRLAEGADVFGHGERFFADELKPGAFPDYVLAHRDRFADFIQPCDQEYLKRTALSRKLARVKGIVKRCLSSLIPSPVVRVLSAWRHRPKG